MTNNLSSDSIIHSNPKDSIMVRGLKRVDFGFIPEDWLCLTLSEICELTSSKRIFESDYVSDGIPFYRGQEVSSLLLGKRIEDVIYIDKDKFEKLKAKFGAPEQGDILITAVGTLGNSFLVNNDEPFYFKDGNLIWARKIKNTNPRFLIALLEFNKQRVLATAIGSSQKALTMAALNPLQLPIPPSPAEQTAIANALSDVDALIQELEKLIAKKQAIKTATMQQLLTGRTRLPQFAHHPDGRKKGYKPSELGEIPEDWEFYNLPEKIWFQEGPGLRKWQFTNKGLKVINVTNLQENGFLDLDRTDRHVSWEEFEKTYKHFACDEGDLVIASSGNSYCKVSIVRACDLPLLMNTSVIRFKPLDNFSKQYMDVFLKSKYFKDQIDLMITGGAQPNFGPAHLNLVKILAPTCNLEQDAVASILCDMEEEIQALEQRLSKTRQIKKGMMQELLTGKTRLVQPLNKESQYG